MLEEGSAGEGFEERAEFAVEGVFVVEGEDFGVGFEEEVEGVDDAHVSDEVDFDGEGTGGFGEDEACKVIALRILLPVNEVIGRLYVEGVAVDGGAAVGRGTEADHLRREGNEAVVVINGAVV